MDDDPLPRPHLSPRQITILTMLSQGKRQSEIAKELAISTHTVRSYIYVAFQRLGAHNAASAVTEFLRLGQEQPWVAAEQTVE